MLNRIKIVVSLCVFVGFICLIMLSNGFEIPENITAVSADKSFPIIVLDPGHGGKDPGAVKGEIVEKDINLQIAKKTSDILLLLGVQTILTRTQDNALGENKALDLKGRVEIANRYETSLFVSIHQNMFSQSKYFGSQVFFGNCKGEDLAKQIQASIVAHLQPENKRQVKNGEYLYVLEHCENTSVMIECGFMSNPTELRKLTDDSYQNSLSYIIGTAVLGFVIEEKSI